MVIVLQISGASCPDGSSFISIVPGSLWVRSSGVYLLQGCPPGYELIVLSEVCSMCPAFSYCLGGSNAHIPCPDGMFSMPGSNSSLLCYRPTFVVISLKIPSFIEDFSTADQTELRKGLALAAEDAVGKVVIQSISSSSFEVTRIISMIARQDAVSAAHLRVKLAILFLNSSILSQQGIPLASLDAVSVTACTPGFELVIDESSLTGSDGICDLCPASYFCVGGSAGRVPCPTGSFAAPGSNSSMNCDPAVFVLIAVSLPIFKVNFTASIQEKFTTSLALTVGVKVDTVTILSIQQLARRTSPPAIQVNSQIATGDLASASSVRSSMDISKLNSQLSKSGLPAGSLVSIAIPESATGTMDNNQGVIIGSLVGSFLALLILLLIFVWVSLRKHETDEEKTLRLRIVAIRKELQIQAKDGFYLTSERPSFFHGGDEAVFCRQSHIEAAARLALGQDFEVHLFDAFCMDLEADGAVASKNRIEALKKWLLKISTALISPDPPELASLRFKFFHQKVAKARIWLEDDGLFAELQRKAHDLMQAISLDCEIRYQELCQEPGGAELIAFQKESTERKMSDDSGQMMLFHGDCSVSQQKQKAIYFSGPPTISMNKAVTGASIRRQDHPEASKRRGMFLNTNFKQVLLSSQK